MFRPNDTSACGQAEEWFDEMGDTVEEAFLFRGAPGRENLVWERQA